MTSCSKELRLVPSPKRPLQITTRAPKGPDFKFELLPLHSPLLGQSLLVSFPPLIDMLKFSGYPYLIRGQNWGGCSVVAHALCPRRKGLLRSIAQCGGRQWIQGESQPEAGQAPNTKRCLRGFMTLEQACPKEYQRAQCAFKDSMIH